MHAFTKSGALQFIQYAIDKGLVNSNTGSGWKASFGKILEEVGQDDSLNDLDVKSEVLRYNNRHPGALSPDSLNQYEKRVQLVIQEFKKYSAGPTTYKGVLTRPSSGNKQNEKKTVSPGKALSSAGSDAAVVEAPPQKHITSAVTETSLMMPFPLRPSFLAQIIIPRDLTKDEAARLCNFIQALAHEPAVAA